MGGFPGDSVDLQPADGGETVQSSLAVSFNERMRHSRERLGGTSGNPQDAHHEGQQFGGSAGPDLPSDGPYPSGEDPYSFFLWSRLTQPLRYRRMANFVWLSRDLGSQRRPARRTRSPMMSSQQSMRDLLYNCTHPSYRSASRLIYFTKENNSGRGFIKESCFSSDGRILISPFANGVRLLAFDDQCRELCDCKPVVPEQPRELHTLKQITSHTKVVLTTRFSPTHNLFVTGGMDGSVAFLSP